MLGEKSFENIFSTVVIGQLRFFSALLVSSIKVDSNNIK